MKKSEQQQTDWAKAMRPLLKKYKGTPHPLAYRNLYQLLVMVVLSAQDSDKNINAVAPAFFKSFPGLRSLSTATEEELLPYLKKVRGHRKKITWLLDIAAALKADKNIPRDLDGLVKLKGIGRKSANVIMREAGEKAEGVIVDLHVMRVAPRLGIASGTDPKKIEQQIMEALPEKQWAEAGMAISFLGREICRPSHPEHAKCIMRNHCNYFQEQQRAATGKSSKTKKKQNQGN